jgi:serine/threonine-protein kinase
MAEPPSIPPTLAPEAEQSPESPTGASGPSCVPACDTLSDSVIRLRDPDAAPTLPGTPVQQAGRYELLGEIGRGGMGLVMRGRDPELGRDLALKVLLEEGAGRPDVVQRFREEAQIGGQLQHPGVVPVYELGRFDDGRPFFTMKLVKGVTLARLFRERSSPAQDWPRFLGIFAQVCQAVAFAHSRGVIHRDLKPANVMAGAFGEVQVMDWGLAKILAERGARPPVAAEHYVPTVVKVSRIKSDSTETQEGEVLGTPSYMPPEQALGEIDRLDARADVFSLGAILCELLTGTPPYVGPDVQAVLRQARRGELADALARLAACDADAELIGLARRCLAAEPADRPRDAGEVARAVVAYLSGVEERARQAEVERAAAEVRAAGERRARRLTLGLATAMLLLVVAVGIGAWRMHHRRVEAEARQREADHQVQHALDRARKLLDAGWQANDLTQLVAAGAEADKAVEIAHTGRASPELREEAETLASRVKAKQDQARKNNELLDALLDIRPPHVTRQEERDKSVRPVASAEPTVEEQFVAAFRRWGVPDIERIPLEEFIAKLEGQPPVLQAIAAALEVWLLERKKLHPEAEWQHLLRLVDQLDDGQRRRELRQLTLSGRLRAERIAGELAKATLPWGALCDPAAGGSRKRLKELVATVHPDTESVLVVLSLVRALDESGESWEAERLLLSSLAARPDDLVLLEALGRLLEEQKRWAEAVECHRAARALRPRLGIALGKALLETGRAAEAEAVFRDLARKQPDNPQMRFYLEIALKQQTKGKGKD